MSSTKINWMADFKRLMDETGEAGIHVMAAQCEGFHLFAALFGGLAGAIWSGELKVPPE